MDISEHDRMRNGYPATGQGVVARGQRARSMGWLAALAALVFGVGACSTTVPSDAQASGSTSRAPVTAQDQTTSEVPETTTAEPSTTEMSELDPEELVRTISLTQDDVRLGAQITEEGEEMTRSDDQCLMVSSSPWVAGRFSPVYTAEDGTHSVAAYSQVAIEPTADKARQVVAAMNTDQAAQDCELPKLRKVNQEDLDATNAMTDCGLSLQNPSETPIAADALPAGVVGWQFNATVHCALHDQDWSIGSLTLSAAAGRSVILLTLKTKGRPVASGQATPYELEPADVTAIEHMIDRARSAQQL